MEKMSKPPGWGTDSLTKSMEDAYLHRFATFVRMKERFQNLIRLDSWFVEAAEDGWRDQPFPNMLAAFLFVRSHVAYRAACEHATAGQMVEAFVQNRACLECAGYALHIHKNPTLGETWLRRDDDTDAREKMMKAFRAKNIKKTIEKTKPQLEKDFAKLYERAIEFGAHPNQQSVTGSLTKRNTGFSLATRHGGDTAHTFALSSTAMSGFCALEILQEAFREQFEHSGVSANLLEARKRL